jgi:hypothetical protein
MTTFTNGFFGNVNIINHNWKYPDKRTMEKPVQMPIGKYPDNGKTGTNAHRQQH